MKEPQPNLFNALFSARPRSDLTPKENFLSEAFAYILQSSEIARDMWISKVLGHNVKAMPCEVFTRKSEPLGETTVYPDLVIEATVDDGKSPVFIYQEHKWDAGCGQEQLQKYHEVAKRKGRYAVVFIGATLDQLAIARKTKLSPNDAQTNEPRIECFLWEDIARLFASISGKDFIIIQFLEFMKTQGLGPLTPLSMSGLVALLEAPKAEEGISGAIKALKGMDWEIVPERYRANPEIKRTWGATAIYFATQGWNPTISIGFLIDPTDHQVQMTNPDKGIDLMLRINSHPNNLGLEKIGSVIAELKNRKKALGTVADSVLLLNESGNRNGHSLLVVQKCLADVVFPKETAREQLEAIYKTLISWLGILFLGGSLESALIASGLVGKKLNSNVQIAPNSDGSPNPD